VERQIQTKLSYISELEEKFSKSTTENLNLVKELSSRTASNEQLTAQLNRFKVQIEHYEKQIGEQLKRIADLEDRGEKSNQEISSYKVRYPALLS
jgi:septal ring factor EnvC (AmiA/AmiB activator)